MSSVSIVKYYGRGIRSDLYLAPKNQEYLYILLSARFTAIMQIDRFLLFSIELWQCISLAGADPNSLPEINDVSTMGGKSNS
jgi:hypothetical protein